VLAAFATAAFFLLLTVKLVLPALACGIAALALVIAWLWSTDPGPSHPPVDIGSGLRLPVYVTGSSSHSWWAMVVLLLVFGSIFASLVFAYFFLWTVSPDVWPAVTGQAVPHPAWPIAAALLLALSSGAVAYASRALADAPARGHWPARLALLAAVPLLAGAFGLDLYAHLSTGLRPEQSSYGAVVFTVSVIQGLLVATLVLMALYTLARSLCGLLGKERRATFDNTMLLWHYAAGQGLIGLVLTHLASRLLG
jgi:cytochrome c oxidase subunit I+III